MKEVFVRLIPLPSIVCDFYCKLQIQKNPEKEKIMKRGFPFIILFIQVSHVVFWLEASILVTGCIDEGDAAGHKEPPDSGAWRALPCPANEILPSRQMLLCVLIPRALSPVTDRLYEAIVPSRHTCETLTFVGDYRNCSKCRMLKSIIWLQ